MTKLDDAFGAIVKRPLSTRNDPYYLPFDEWLIVQKELEQKLGYPPVGQSGDYMNFLLGGIQVRPDATS